VAATTESDFKSSLLIVLHNMGADSAACCVAVLQAQATGKGPLANLADHLSNPGANNWVSNINHCVTPSSVDVQVRAAWYF
jgi:light-harvesting complex I chlorophyll a/b binding protein 4